jgi:hypothetical protein
MTIVLLLSLADKSTTSAGKEVTISDICESIGAKMAMAIFALTDMATHVRSLEHTQLQNRQTRE